MIIFGGEGCVSRGSADPKTADIGKRPEFRLVSLHDVYDGNGHFPSCVTFFSRMRSFGGRWKSRYLVNLAVAFDLARFMINS